MTNSYIRKLRYFRSYLLSMKTKIQGYNMEDNWDFYHIWIRLDENIKKGQWVNIFVPKKHIKDKSLEDFNIKNI